jgi:6-phosphogluconate dehydrogenase
VGAPTRPSTARWWRTHHLQHEAERVAAAEVLPGPDVRYTGDRQQLIDSVRQALYASKISAYAQGMAMLRAASQEYGYDLNLAEVAAIWRNGCIIRARFLNRITAAFERNAALANLLLDDDFARPCASGCRPGATSCRLPSRWAFRRRPLAPAWPTMTATAAHGCRPI